MRLRTKKSQSVSISPGVELRLFISSTSYCKTLAFYLSNFTKFQPTLKPRNQCPPFKWFKCDFFIKIDFVPPRLFKLNVLQVIYSLKMKVVTCPIGLVAFSGAVQDYPSKRWRPSDPNRQRSS